MTDDDDSATRRVKDCGPRALALVTAAIHNDWGAINRLLTGAVQVDARGTMLALLGMLIRMVEVAAQASGSDAETLLRTMGASALIGELEKWELPADEP
jgi:hypothetical protein